ncbi:MAG: hypothetical protein K2N50_00870 [Clostridia bacterium]|nr:hypothetical protein [Clostridia bacterium]
MLENGIETEEIEIDATAHSWGEWQITPATCTSAGEKMRVCKNNAEHTEREVIPAIGHEFSTKFTIDTPATCTTAGSKSKHCTHAGCNEKMEVTEIAALQHDWGEWTVETAVTCEQDGLEKRTCKRSGCGESETRAIVHEGHKYVAETTPPTCTEDGYTTHTCSVCGNSYTDGIIKAVGHSYGQPLWEWNGYLSATAAFECGNCNDCQTVPAMIANKVTKEPTYTEQGERTYTATVTFGGTDYTDSKTEAIDMNSKAVNSITFQMSNAVYGEEWEPSATALYGTVNFSYSDELGGTYAATKPQNAGTYYVKASVEEGETYIGAEVIKEFKITPREITVTINSGSSIAGDPLETLTATVTAGSVIDGDNPYTLSTNADISVVGTYAITGTCTDGNYSITFVDGVYIVSQRASDPSGGGEIDIPRDDIDVEFKLTQSSTDRDYSTLDGMKKGYWAQLWYRNEDGTLGDEFTDKMNCVLTLKIPTEIIEGIRGGEKIDRDKIAAGLGVYYVEGSEFVAVKAFTIAQKDDSWIVKFNYNAEFPAEIVFNAAEAEDGQGNANGGTPWWVWLLVCLGGAAVIGVIVVIIVVAKKKNTAAVAAVYDDAELKAKLTEQDRKLDEIKEIVDGGFNDFVDGE